MPVVIDPDRVEDAADAFALKVAPAIDNAVFRLADDLSAGGSMAGADDAGNAWSSSYDHAVRSVMGVAADVTNGSYKLAGLLEMTWGNHARADAEAYARGGVGPDYPHPVDYGDDCAIQYSVPSAAGGTNAEPAGWSLVRYSVGFVWPGGHQDKLRAAANAWGRAATSVSDVSTLIPPAISALQEQQSPEIANAVTVSRAMHDHVCDLSNAYTNLQNACDAYAGFIDKAHSDAGRELKSLVEWTVGIEAVGAIAGVFTAGIAEAPAQGAEAGRIAATAARVAEIIRALISAAKGVGETITSAISRVVEISKELKPLLAARASKAAAEAAAKLPQETKSAEELAESGLKIAKANNRGLDATEFRLTKTVAGRASAYAKDGRLARPYGDSRLTMQEIMDSTEPTADPGGSPAGLRWEVPGTRNGSKGMWELVVDPKTKRVLHFLFKDMK